MPTHYEIILMNELHYLYIKSFHKFTGNLFDSSYISVSGKVKTSSSWNTSSAINWKWLEFQFKLRILENLPDMSTVVDVEDTLSFSTPSSLLYDFDRQRFIIQITMIIANLLLDLSALNLFVTLFIVLCSFSIGTSVAIIKVIWSKS